MANLQSGKKVRLQGLKSAPEFNGLVGVLEDFDSASGRWKVVLNQGVKKVVKTLKADNLVLEEEKVEGKKEDVIVLEEEQVKDKKEQETILLEDEKVEEKKEEITDDGTLKLIRADTDHPKIGKFIDTVNLQIPVVNTLLKKISGLGAPESSEADKWTASAKELQKNCVKIFNGMQNHLEDIDSIDVSEEGFGEVKKARKALIRSVQQILEHLEPAKEKVGELLKLYDSGQKRKREEKEEIEAEEAKWKKRQEELAKARKAEQAEKEAKRKQDQSEADKSKDDKGLTKGKKVKIHSLKGMVALNGQVGTLDSFDKEKGRWQVKLGNGETKALKPENLSLEESQASTKPKSTAKATQAGKKLLDKTLSVTIDLSLNSGIEFDKKCVVASVEEGSQCAKKGVSKGFRVISATDTKTQEVKKFNTSIEVGKALREMKANFRKEAVLEFLAPQHLLIFSERPLGFEVSLDEARGLFIVEKANAFCVNKGVKKGCAVIKVDEADVVGLTQEDLEKRLKELKLPVQILFADIPGEKKAQQKEAPPPPPGPLPSMGEGGIPEAKSAPFKAPDGMTIDDAFKFFGLPETCTKQDVAKAYRKQSAPLHPDKQDKSKSEGALKFVNDKFLKCGEVKDLLLKYFEYMDSKKSEVDLTM